MQTRRLLRAFVRRMPILGRYEIRSRCSTFDGLKAYQKTQRTRLLDTGGLARIHYACGKHFLPGWLNVDSYRQGNVRGAAFEAIDLVSRHPFADNTFEFGFAEDFLEHLSQVDSMLFLSECQRTLIPGGVLRLAFPGLEGVLRKHYPRTDWETVNIAKEEAYTRYEHLHFYSKEELTLVARHFGFNAVTFHAFGESPNESLRGVDQRAAQSSLNTYAELVK